MNFFLLLVGINSVYSDPSPDGSEVVPSIPGLSGEEMEAMWSLAVSVAEEGLLACTNAGESGNSGGPESCLTFELQLQHAQEQLAYYKENVDVTGFTVPPRLTTLPSSSSSAMPNKRCQKGEKECCNGKCIQASYANDSDNDCGDWSDEKGLCGFSNEGSKTTPAPTAINVDELVACALSDCVGEAMKCMAAPTCINLVLDLSTGIDSEAGMEEIMAQAFAFAEKDPLAKPLLTCAVEHCVESAFSSRTTFPPLPKKCGVHEAECCNNLCVSLRYYEDGDNDCGDWSDEKKMCGFKDVKDADLVHGTDYEDDWGDDDFWDGFFGSGSGYGTMGYGGFEWSGWGGWGDNTDWNTCLDAEDPFADVHEACEQDCTFNKGSKGLLADDDDSKGYYGYYSYDDDFGWGDLFGGWFSNPFDDDDDTSHNHDRDQKNLEVCDIGQSEYGEQCKENKFKNKQACQKAINSLSVPEIHHYVEICHGSMPQLFEAHSTTIPELISFYRSLSDTCGGNLNDDNFPLPDQSVLHLMLKEVQRKVAVHCVGDKPDFEIGHCRGLTEEVKQLKSQVHPDIAAAANIQTQLDSAKADAAACTEQCSQLLSQISDLSAQLAAAQIKANTVLSESKAGSVAPAEPSTTTDQSKRSKLVGVIVGVVGVVLGVAIAAFFVVRSNNREAPLPAVAAAPLPQVGAHAFDNPNYNPNARETEEPAYEDMGGQASPGYMDIPGVGAGAGYIDVSPNGEAEA